MSVSIFIQTLNEEQNLPGLLDTISWSDDIVVLDSLSKDRTEEIARERGCRWYARAYNGRGPHQNWAVENIPFRNKWVFQLDADERMPVELRDEVLRIASSEQQEAVAYRVRYKNFLFGRWIRHCGIYPTWILRFFQPQKVRWERMANPISVVDGPVGYLQEHFHHYSFNKGLDAWFEKHNKYSLYEAMETIKSLNEGNFSWTSLFVRDPALRRRALKEFSFRLPFRPSLRFLYMYFMRLGFLDGKEGFTYCKLLAVYEWMIVLKIHEIRRIEKNLPI